MSRRKPQGSSQRMDTTIRVVCACGLPLGAVLKRQHTGEYLVAGKYLAFRDRPEPTPTSGKVAGRCPECWAEFQRRWDRVCAQLDANEQNGTTRDVIHGG